MGKERQRGRKHVPDRWRKTWDFQEIKNRQENSRTWGKGCNQFGGWGREMCAPLFPYYKLRRILHREDEGSASLGKEHWMETGLQGSGSCEFCALDLKPLRDLEPNKSWILPGALKRCLNGLERYSFLTAKTHKLNKPFMWVSLLGREIKKRLECSWRKPWYYRFGCIQYGMGGEGFWWIFNF